MTLRELLGDGPDDVEITGLAYDNRAVEPGTLFFCVPGFTRDGHDFAPDAIARGAAALVVARPLGLGVPEVQVEDVRAAMARAAARFYGDPTARAARRRDHRDERQDHDGVPRPRAARGGRAARPGCSAPSRRSSAGEERPVVRTTPEAIDLQRTFREMLDGGDRRLRDGDLLARARAAARRRDPLSRPRCSPTSRQDHLDFHPTMEDYFQAKRRLFATPLPTCGSSTSTIAYGRRLADEFAGAVTFGDRRRGRLPRARRAHRRSRARDFTLRGAGRRVSTCGSPLPGRFNVANALGAWAAARALGARAGARWPPRWPTPARVPGRFEPVDEGQPFAVARRLRAQAGRARERAAARRASSPTGRVIVVFGAGGDRDRGKRPLMGEIARAARRRGDRHLRQPALGGPGGDRRRDPRRACRRRRATSSATSTAARRSTARSRSPQPGDVVVIAGKGHEQGQEFAGGRKEPFDDVAVAREALRGGGAAREGAGAPRRWRRAAGASSLARGGRAAAARRGP